MPERIGPGPITSAHCAKEAVCIHTDKVYDSCKEKDCLEDLRVIFTRQDQDIINNAINVKAKKAEIIWVFTEAKQNKHTFPTFNLSFLYLPIDYINIKKISKMLAKIF